MFENLKNEDLNAKIKSLAAEERGLTSLILEHIAEVDRRKLYLVMAYPSLYEYLTREIGYSEGAAQRRIDAARLLQRLPEVSTKIKDGAVTLAQISKLQQICRMVKREGRPVTAIAQKDVLEKITGLGAAQTDLVLAREFDVAVKIATKQMVQKDESVRVELTFSKSEMALLKKAQDVLSHKTGGDLKGTLLEMAQKILKMAEPKSQSTATMAAPKSITPRLRRDILARDKCCQYRDKITGKICGATAYLEVDHIQPRFAEGDNSDQNLRVLCRNHNQHRYRSEL